MSTIRISKVLSELNIGLDTAVDFLANKGQEVERNRNAKIDQAQYDLLTQQFATDKSSKDKAETLIQQKREEKEAIQAEREQKKPEVIRATTTLSGPKVAGKIELAPKKAEAAALYLKLASDFPRDPRPLLALALLRQEQGDTKAAQEAMAMARSRQPDRPDPRLDQVAASWGLSSLRKAALSPS